MGETNRHDKGSFCWFEVVSTDAAKSGAFFKEVLGWDYRGMPMPEGPPDFKLIQLGGKDIGGLYELTVEMKDAGTPPHMLGYLAVEDLDGVIGKVESLGGKILMGKTAVGDMGHMAMIATSEGATNCLWESRSQSGSILTGVPGTPCRFELNTRDADGVAEFFSKLLDLEVWTVPFPDPNCPGDYVLLGREGKPFFGLLQMGEEWGDMPSHWMTYFQVADIGAACEAIKRAGGEVCYDPFELTDVGQIAICTDPCKIYFTVLEPVKA